MIITIIGRIAKSGWTTIGGESVFIYDDFGYYLYLPAAFIYDDLAIEDPLWVNELKEKYCEGRPFIQANRLENGKHVMQYTAGNAILMSPAFFLGHLFASNSDLYEADGFTAPYKISIVIYAIFFFLMGLIFLRMSLLNYFSEGLSALLLLICCLGTNLIQLVISNTISPHIFLFSLYAFLLYFIPIWYEKGQLKHLIILAIVLSLMVLNRPTEIIAVLLILFWNLKSKSDFKKRLEFYKEQRRNLLLITPIAFVIGGIQVAYWLYTSGQPIFDSYLVEDFKFMDPYLFEFLFSYKKGWLIYTPIMLLLFPALYSMWKNQNEYFLPIFTFSILYIYVLSSWDCWWYAASFGQRSISQAYPILLLPFGFLLKGQSESVSIKKSFIYLIIIMLIPFNLFQVWQESQAIIHPIRMTKEYYWAIFGDTKPDISKIHLLEIDREEDNLPDSIFNTKTIIGFTSFEEHSNFSDSIWFEEELILGDPALYLDGPNAYSQNFKWKYSDIANSDEFYYLLSFNYKTETSGNGIRVVTNAEDHRSNKIYGWGSKWLNELSQVNELSSGWKRCSLIYVPPHHRSYSDIIYSHLWNTDGKRVEFDDLLIEAWTKEEDKLPNLTYLNDFASIKHGMWSTPFHLIEQKGSVYQKLDTANIFSSSLKIEELEINKVYKVKATAGILNRRSDMSQIALSLHNDDEQLLYEAQYVARSDDWQKLEWELEISTSFDALTHLTFYAWNNSHEPVLVDYLMLVIEEK